MKTRTLYGGVTCLDDYVPEPASHHPALLALPWETKRTARHEYFMSDKQLAYSYDSSGDYVSKPVVEPVTTIMRALNAELGVEFNACFLNKYDNAHQHLGWHADNFKGMDQTQPIAVVSFGAEREIWVKDQRGFACLACDGSGCPSCNLGFTKAPPNGKQPLDQRILLKDGSLFVMPAGYQDSHFHRIPKCDRECGWRISLTFRCFKDSAPFEP